MWKRVVFFVYLAILSCAWWSIFRVFFYPLQPGEFEHEDMGYDISQLVKRHGYLFQNHTTVTKDGYILEMHRILSPQQKPDKGPVLLVHGVCLSSTAFVIMGPHKALAYYLADNGYDVWLANARGNEYSRKHRKLDPDTNHSEFFDFSWHEIGIYDLPANIDYILDVTTHDKIYYIGFSQGTTSSVILLSERPEYNDKIKLWIGLAPVIFNGNCKTPVFRLPAHFQQYAEALFNYGFREFFPKSKHTVQLANEFCSANSFLQRLCTFILGVSGGFNGNKINLTRLPLVYSHLLTGASFKQILHFSQVVNSNLFRQYDYGTKINMKLYNRITPPKYNMSNMRVPSVLYYGENDWFTGKKDLDKLHKKLPNIVKSRAVIDKLFTHFDFLFSDHATDILYADIIHIMKEFR